MRLTRNWCRLLRLRPRRRWLRRSWRLGPGVRSREIDDYPRGKIAVVKSGFVLRNLVTILPISLRVHNAPHYGRPGLGLTSPIFQHFLHPSRDQIGIGEIGAVFEAFVL